MGDNAIPLDKEKIAEEEAPFPLTDVDRWVLSQTDEEFHLHDWEELKAIVGMNDNSLLSNYHFAGSSI